MSIGPQLRDARQALGKTQFQIAHAAGMHIAQYNAYERGRSRPAAATLERIAAALHTTSAALQAQNIARPTWGANLRTMREQFEAQVAEVLGISPREVSIRIEVGPGQL